MVGLGDFMLSPAISTIKISLVKNWGSITSQNGLHQEINEPVHILNNFSSCIDLNSQPNLLIESGVHPSLHSNCHHQIIFAKFNLDIVYPPSYEREIWQ